jgi:hypothetical protein
VGDFALIKEHKMKKDYVKGIACIALILAMVLAACSQPTGGGSPSVQTGNEQAINSWPNFEGTFVASETEATTLATTSEAQIQSAIAAAVANGVAPTSSIVARAANQSGHYVYNGVTLDYTYAQTGTVGQYPYSINLTEKGTIDGTYSGYTIKGHF